MKTKKNAAQSVTMWGILLLALPIVSAIRETGWTTENIGLALGWLGTLFGRMRQGDLSLTSWGKSLPPAALFLLGVGTFSGCAAPASEQGRASQGGSTGQQPVVNVAVTFGGQVRVDGLSSGTAAPSAASEAQARQDAKQDTKLDVPIDASGLVPGAAAGKVLGGLKAPAVPKPAPEVIPVKIDVSTGAPVESVPAKEPAPVDETVPPKMEPIGEAK